MTDVVGRLVEVMSGQSLDVFMRERIFEPLKMADTHFYLDDTKDGRLMSQYRPGEDKKIVLEDPGSTASRWVSGPKKVFRGAGGLVSTAHDYVRFQQAMLNGGELDGARLLAPMSQGSAYWGGAYCTLSWIDPEQEVIGIVMTQVRPYGHIIIRQDFQVLVSQSILE